MVGKLRSVVIYMLLMNEMSKENLVQAHLLGGLFCYMENDFFSPVFELALFFRDQGPAVVRGMRKYVVFVNAV